MTDMTERFLCVLVLDGSLSMTGSPIEELNRGLGIGAERAFAVATALPRDADWVSCTTTAGPVLRA